MCFRCLNYFLLQVPSKISAQLESKEHTVNLFGLVGEFVRGKRNYFLVLELREKVLEHLLLTSFNSQTALTVFFSNYFPILREKKLKSLKTLNWAS